VSIKDYIKDKLNVKLKNYGSSFVYKVYNVNNLPSQETFINDVDKLIDEYTVLIEKEDGIIKPSIKSTTIEQKNFDFNVFLKSLSNSNLQFNENIVKRFVASLITKPFVILTGLADSGKTKLAQSFIQWISESEEQYKIVPVGADWINREPLLGYPNGLKSDEYVTPDNGVLELMLNAALETNQDKPYFLVLHEMNL